MTKVMNSDLQVFLFWYIYYAHLMLSIPNFGRKGHSGLLNITTAPGKKLWLRIVPLFHELFLNLSLMVFLH